MQTILLVDNEPHMLEIAERTLNTFGYNVISRTDAESALSVIRDGIEIDLVITDYGMPGMNGVELLAILRKAMPSVPVIMLTRHTSVEIYLQSIGEGAFEYLTKPFKKRELYRTVRSALHRPADDGTLLAS
jgi:DNA-binding NtrC family response regulator